jgi:hypothetical protein
LVIDYPGQDVFARDKYWSLKQFGERGPKWWLSKNKGEDKDNEPFRRAIFANPYEALKAVFDEFMVNSVSFIRRKADHQPELWN